MVLLAALTSCEDKEKEAQSEKLTQEVSRLRAEVEELSRGVEEVDYENVDYEKLQQEAEVEFEQAKSEVAGLEALLEEARTLREEV